MNINVTESYYLKLYLNSSKYFNKCWLKRVNNLSADQEQMIDIDFVYSEDPSEQRAHDIRHARALGFIDFKGWKRETKVDCPELDGRIVIVKYRDANNHWDKVNISQNFDYPVQLLQIMLERISNTLYLFIL